MTSQEDCYFFFNSTCTKGDDCAFRHEPSALGNSVVCEQWKTGSCTRNPCHLRHGVPEVPRLTAPCFYENTPTGCLNYSCQYQHQKPRPFRPEHLFHHVPWPPGILRPGMSQPRLNVPFQPRFIPGHNQQVRGPANHRMQLSPRKMQNVRPQPEMLPPNDMRSAVVPNRPRGPVPPPNFPDTGPRLFQGRDLSSRNAPGQQHYFQPRHQDSGANTAIRSLMGSENQPVQLGDNVIGNVNHMARHNDGPGLLGQPPFLPLALGGIFPFNITPEQITQRPKSKPSESRTKGSSKRTVKKVDSKPHRKSVKPFRHDDRRSSQDSIDMKRKRKDKRSSKETKGTSRQRKVKMEDGSHSDRLGQRPADLTSTLKNEEEDLEQAEKDVDNEANLSFKVKTLEEILRDKALKKLRERQQMKECEGNSNTASTSTDNEVSKLEELKGEHVNNGEARTCTGDNPSTVISLEKIPNEVSSSGKNSLSSDSQQNTMKREKDLSAVKVKTLDEIRRSKATAGDVAESERESKLVENETRKTRDRTLKPLKPLNNKNNKNIKNNGRTVVTVSRNRGSSTHRSNQTSDEDKKKPLPPLRRLSKSPVDVSPNRTLSEKTLSPHTRNVSEKFLKRKLEQQAYRKLVKTSKIRRLVSNPESGTHSPSVVETVDNVDSFRPSVPKVECRVLIVTSSSGEERDLESDCSSKSVTPGAGGGEETEGINTESGPGFVPSALPSVQETSKQLSHPNTVKDVLGKKSVELESSCTVETPAVTMEKPVKKIKLKRIGLLGPKTVMDSEGTSRDVGALGRKIKVNRRKALKTQVAVQKVTDEETSKISGEVPQGSSGISEVTDITQNCTTTVKEAPNFSKTAEVSPDAIRNQEARTSSVDDSDHLPAEHERKIGETYTVAEDKSRLSGKTSGNPLLKTNSEIPVITNATQEPVHSDSHKGRHSSKVELVQSVENMQKQSSLDQLVKEVSDDIRGEDDDLLDEELEKAIAELSPAPMDDEDDVSNADDLLLEIEEMINS